MTDQQPELTTPTIAQTEPAPYADDREIENVRSLLPVPIVGFMVALFALLVLLWPTGSYGQSVQLVSQFRRIVSPLANEDSLNVPRRILDIGIYMVMLVGLACLIVAWRRGSRSAIIGLVGVSILGLSYSSGMSLYVGPMISTCGFTLMLFGGVIMWATSRDPNQPLEQPIHDKIDPDTGKTL